MERIVEMALQLSTTGKEADLMNLHKRISDHDTQEAINRHSGNLETFLSCLHPTTHTLAFTLILVHMRTSNQAEHQKFLAFFNNVVSDGDFMQLKVQPSSFFKLCHKATESYTTTSPISGVHLLQMALEKIKNRDQPQILPIHADLMKLCVASRLYKVAIPYVMEEFDTVSEHTTPESLLCWLYYGGMACIAMREYPKAYDLFKTALLLPTHQLSAIQLEIYKKFILVSLISGESPTLSKALGANALHVAKALATDYIEFATAFSTQDVDAVHRYAETHIDAFKKDKNFGLVKRAIVALYKQNIHKHTKIYLTLPLSEIQASLKLPSTSKVRDFVLRMIEDGQIAASINMRDGILAFHEETESYNSDETTQRISNQIRRAMTLNRKLESLDQELQLNSTYIQKTFFRDHHGGPGGNFAMGGDFEDEMMAGPFARDGH
ncbi:COP9 signalosome complex subunit 3 [Pelomyxa schiedti]|nr:COP9 signalosome complex subunit 3 [Pelomyxa schiedti]